MAQKLENLCGCRNHACTGHDHDEGGGHNRSLGRLKIAVIGAFFVANSYILTWIQPDLTLSADLSAMVGALIMAFPLFKVAIEDLAKGIIHMNELVSLAVLAALAGGDFRTAGIISFFLLISVIIETKTASGAQRSIEKLIKLMPNTSRKIVDGQEVEVEVARIAVGDIIRVRPGENFPVDGKIVDGYSTVNQASITGESLPIEKEIGMDVFAGTQNLTGVIDVEVTKAGHDTTLGKIQDLIMAAESSRPPIVRIIDQYAGYYTPTIVMIAGLTWLFTREMNNVIAILVISCPCALVLASPSAVVASLAAAARLGIFIKDVSYLELASKIRNVVFDKTGTLTEGNLSVARLQPAQDIQPAELLKIASSVEQHSNHPTAKALQILAGEAGLKLDEVKDFSELHGKGVEATYKGQKCHIGRKEWLEKIKINLSGIEDPGDDVESVGMSVVYVAYGEKAMGWIGFRDTVRKEASEAIKTLLYSGIKRCSMVTGDRASVAEIVAKGLNIEDFRSHCLPDDKVEFVKELKKSSYVAVVGDGINDAPALAAGDLGIAMGAIGSDIAIDSASIALMTNDLRRIPMLFKLAKKSSAIINQNIFIGFLFIIGGISLSVFGLMPPIAAAVLHTVSTLVIIFNSARLVRTGEELTYNESR